MKQLKYSFRDIKNNKGFYLSTVIQLAITFLIIGNALTQTFGLMSGLQKLSELSEKKSYVMVDSTTEAQLNKIFDNEEQSVDKLRQFFKEIESLDNIYISWKYSMMTYNNAYNVTRLTANKNFLDLYGIKICKGRMFSEDDYCYDDNAVPILVGYELQSVYELGKTYIISDGGIDIEVEVVGVLKNNSSYLRLGDFGEESLNDTIILPFSSERLIKSEQISDYDMALQSIIFIPDDNKSIEVISLLLQNTDTFFMHFEKLDENLQELVDYLRPQIEYEIVISGIILFFAMIGFVSNLIIMINNSMIEYAVHMFCGASIVDLIKRILIQSGLVMLISLIPTVIFYRWKIVLWLLVIGVFLFVLIIPFILATLRKKKVTDVIRRFA